MEIKASLKHLRMSAQKVRLVVDLVRRAKVAKALDQLRFINKKAAQPVAKLIKSAVANAVNNFELDKDNLYIKTLRVDEAVTLKRWMPKAHGRATTIRKRACHVHLILAEITESGKKVAKKQKIEEPVKLETLVNAKDQAVNKKLKPAKKQVKESEEVAKEIVDPRMEGRHGHAKVEGQTHNKGFASKMFRRKSG